MKAQRGIGVLLAALGLGSSALAYQNALDSHRRSLLYHNDALPYYAKSFLSSASQELSPDAPEYLASLLDRAQNELKARHLEAGEKLLSQIMQQGAYTVPGMQARLLQLDVHRGGGEASETGLALQGLLSDKAYERYANIIASRLALIDLASKHPEQGSARLDKLISKQYGYAEAVLVKGLCYLGAGSYQTAAETMETLHFEDVNLEGIRLLYLAESYYFAGNLSSALINYEAVLGLNATANLMTEAAYGRAMAIYQVKPAAQAKLALELYLKAYAPSTYDDIVRYHLALSEEKLGNAQAAADLLKTLNNSELSQSSQFGVIRNLFKAGNMAETAETARRFRNRYPNSKYFQSVLVYEAQSQLSLGKYAAAGQVFEMLANRFSNRKDIGKIIYKMSYAYLRGQNYAKAVAGFDRYMTQTKESDNTYQQALISKGEALYQMKNFAYAIDVYQKAYKLSTDENIRQHILYGLGWCHFKQRQFEDSVNAFLQAIALNPQNPMSENAWFKVAESYVRLGQVAQARVVYEDIETRFPKLTRMAAWEKAMMYYRADDFAEARKLLSEYSARFPNNDRDAEAAYWIAWTQYRQNHTEAAVAGFAELKAKFSKTKYGREAQFRIADSYFNNQQWDKAADAYRQTLTYDEWVEDAYYGLILSQLRLNQTDKAEETLNQYIAQFPNGMLIAELKEKLQQQKQPQTPSSAHLDEAAHAPN